MADPAVFQGSLVNLKNSPTHKSVILQVEIPEEYGEAIVRAFGWPTRVKPLPVAVARLATEAPAAEGNQDWKFPGLMGTAGNKPKRRFDDLSPAEQAGIVCKQEDFARFLRSTKPYSNAGPFTADYQPEDLVREICGVKSRADIKEGTNAHLQWRILMELYRRWQDERNRLDIDF